MLTLPPSSKFLPTQADPTFAPRRAIFEKKHSATNASVPTSYVRIHQPRPGKGHGLRSQNERHSYKTACEIYQTVKTLSIAASVPLFTFFVI